VGNSETTELVVIEFVVVCMVVEWNIKRIKALWMFADWIGWIVLLSWITIGEGSGGIVVVVGGDGEEVFGCWGRFEET